MKAFREEAPASCSIFCSLHWRVAHAHVDEVLTVDSVPAGDEIEREHFLVVTVQTSICFNEYYRQAAVRKNITVFFTRNAQDHVESHEPAHTVVAHRDRDRPHNGSKRFLITLRNGVERLPENEPTALCEHLAAHGHVHRQADVVGSEEAHTEALHPRPPCFTDYPRSVRACDYVRDRRIVNLVAIHDEVAHAGCASDLEDGLVVAFVEDRRQPGPRRAHVRLLEGCAHGNRVLSVDGDCLLPERSFIVPFVTYRASGTDSLFAEPNAFAHKPVVEILAFLRAVHGVAFGDERSCGRH